mgnify:CR=1 FL=1
MWVCQVGINILDQIVHKPPQFQFHPLSSEIHQVPLASLLQLWKAIPFEPPLYYCELNDQSMTQLLTMITRTFPDYSYDGWPLTRNELEYSFTLHKDGNTSVVALTVVAHLQTSSFHTSHPIKTASEKTFPTSVRTYFTSDRNFCCPPLLHLQPFLLTWYTTRWSPSDRNVNRLEPAHSALHSPITH